MEKENRVQRSEDGIVDGRDKKTVGMFLFFPFPVFINSAATSGNAMVKLEYLVIVIRRTCCV